MASELGFGIIGCGEIAVATAQGIADAPNARIARVMDVREELARDLGQKHGAPWTTSQEDLLADPAVEAVYVAVPHFLHAPITVAAAAAGKHVLCEKPIATTLADADRMIAATRAAGVALSIPFAGLTTSTHRRAQHWIQEGLIGKVVGIQVFGLSDKPASYWQGGYSGRSPSDWRTQREKSGGGILVMNLVYNVNDLRQITGLKPVRIYAEWDTFNTPGVDVEDYIAVSVRYDNGAIGTYLAGSAVPGRGRGISRGDRIIGTDGQIILGHPLQLYVNEARAGFPAREWQEVNIEEEPGSERSKRVKNFAAAVLDGQKPPVTGEDGRDALEFILASYRSGERHEPVTLPFAE
jgi:UDP-N-acetyl-2-amino-2-deoxyglucuronate dehydrogenase